MTDQDTEIQIDFEYGYQLLSPGEELQVAFDASCEKFDQDVAAYEKRRRAYAIVIIGLLTLLAVDLSALAFVIWSVL